MFWRGGIPIILLAWMLLAAPAAAGVQRLIDDQGVIRIDNNAATQPGQSRQGSPSTATAAPEPVGKPESRPPQSAGEKLHPAPELPAAATPPNPPR